MFKMAKTLKAAAALIVLGLLINPVSQAFADDSVQDQVSDNINLGNPDYSNSTGCDNNPSMLFQPAITGYLDSIDLPIRKYGPRVDGFNIDIMPYNEKKKSVDTGTLLASQGVSAENFPDDNQGFVWSSFNLDERPQLIADKKYVIRIFAPYDGHCDGGYQWGMRKWDAPDYLRGKEIIYDNEYSKWVLLDNDFGFKTYMTAHEPEIVIADSPAKPSISFYLGEGQKKLSASDIGRLSKLLANTSSNSTGTCNASQYGSSAKAKQYALELAKSVCGSLKKLKPSVTRALKVTSSEVVGKAARGSKWFAGSYRVDISIATN